MDIDPELASREHLFGQDVHITLARALGETSKPPELISFIQRKFGLQEPASDPVLPLLDLLGASRAESYSYVLHHLLEKLRERLSKMSSSEQLEPFLQLTFPYIGVEELKSVPIAILERIPRVPEALLRTLSSPDYRAVYRELPIAVKRQVWESSEGTALFREHVLPLIDRYASEAAAARAHLELLNSPGPPRKRRGESGALRELCEAVGASGPLYERVVGLLRQRYAEAPSGALCTLRSDLVMAAHEAGASALYERDACHKLAWCLDACLGLKDGLLDARQVREIEGFLAGCGREAVADAALVLHDPHVEHALVRNVLAGLHECARRAALPRFSARLVHVTRLLALAARAVPGFKAPERGDKEPTRAAPDPALLRELYPALVGVLVDSAVARAGKARGDGTLNPAELRQIDLGPPPAALAPLVAASGHARKAPPPAPSPSPSAVLALRGGLAQIVGALALAGLRRGDVPLFLHLAPLLAPPPGEPRGWASEEALVFGYSLASELVAPGPVPQRRRRGGGRRGGAARGLGAAPPRPGPGRPGARLLGDARLRAAALPAFLLPLSRACALGHEAALRVLLVAATLPARAGGYVVKDPELLSLLREATERGRLTDPVGSAARTWASGAGATTARTALAAYRALLERAPDRLHDNSAQFIMSYIKAHASLAAP
eukprot:tig00001215_g7584.t2